MPAKSTPGDHREAAHDRQLAGDREAILVVDGRVLDADVDVAVHEVGGREGRARDGLGLGRLVARDQAEL